MLKKDDKYINLYTLKKNISYIIILTLCTFIFSIQGISQKKFRLEKFDVATVSKDDSSTLAKTWKTFLCHLNNENLRTSDLLCDTVYCTFIGKILSSLPEIIDRPFSVSLFIDSIIGNFKDTAFLNVITKNTFYMNSTTYYSANTSYKGVRTKKITLYDIIFLNYSLTANGRKNEEVYKFRFLKTSSNFKLFEVRLLSPN